jgi:hypothetical protein
MTHEPSLNNQAKKKFSHFQQGNALAHATEE